MEPVERCDIHIFAFGMQEMVLSFARIGVDDAVWVRTKLQGTIAGKMYDQGQSCVLFSFLRNDT